MIKKLALIFVAACLAVSGIVFTVKAFPTIHEVNIEKSKKSTGRSVTKEYNLSSSFNKISVSSAIEVDYSVSSTSKVVITLPEEYADNLYVKVKNGELQLAISGGVTTSGNEIKAKVTGPMLDEISTASASNFTMTQPISINGKQLEINTSSASVVNLASVVCGKLEIDTSSASTVNIGSVECNKLDIETSSASSVNLSNIKASKVEVESSSASSVTLSGSCQIVDFEASSTSKIDASSLSAENGRAESSSMAKINCNVKNLSQESSSMSSISNNR